MRDKAEITRLSDLPKAPITIGDMIHNRTGLWRYLMPVVKDRTAPCRNECPLGMPSPDYINDLVRNNLARALDRILEVNPLPGLTGRLCYHPCQSKCLRRGLDGSVQIQMLERYLADTAPWPAIVPPQKAEASVMVLGAGPLGLSTAYFLGRIGISVTIFDPLDRPGGFLLAVDQDQLPWTILDREINRLVGLAHIQLRLGVDDSSLEAGEVPLDSGGMGQRRCLVIHDHTAHAKGSDPAESLSRMAGRLSEGRQWLDTAGICPEGRYKASQIAMAVAAGRDLAGVALTRLGVLFESEALKNRVKSGRTESPLSAKDIRYELFDRQVAVEADRASQTYTDEEAQAEAGRCLSCGHCNLCGRCLMFCPDVSLRINDTGTRLEIDEMHCKGCGICAYECPRRAIEMER